MPGGKGCIGAALSASRTTRYLMWRWSEVEPIPGPAKFLWPTGSAVFDEPPEYGKNTLDVFRQPLEGGTDGIPIGAFGNLPRTAALRGGYDPAPAVIKHRSPAYVRSIAGG